jgi:hypothetical protein
MTIHYGGIEALAMHGLYSGSAHAARAHAAALRGAVELATESPAVAEQATGPVEGLFYPMARQGQGGGLPVAARRSCCCGMPSRPTTVRRAAPDFCVLPEHDRA